MKKWIYSVMAFVLAAAIIAFPQAASAKEVHYVVKSGDSLWKIAQKFDVNLDSLFENNGNLSNFDKIYPYQVIIIPGYVDFPGFKQEIPKKQKPAPEKPKQPTPAPEKPEQPTPAPERPETPAPAPEQPSQDEQAGHAWEQEVVDLVNAERAKAGLSPLQMDRELSDVARAKSEDMRDRGYFSHDSPTYGSPFDMMRQFGIDYRSAGENIAAGQRSPEAVVQAWMDSPGHRENIMNSSYTHIGVGLAEGGSYGYYWTQMFIGK